MEHHNKASDEELKKVIPVKAVASEVRNRLIKTRTIGIVAIVSYFIIEAIRIINSLMAMTVMIIAVAYIAYVVAQAQKEIKYVEQKYSLVGGSESGTDKNDART